MIISTKYRTAQTEIMDDFTIEGEELRDALDKIAAINKLLGGNSLTLSGVRHLLKKADKLKEIIIVDVGCGNGDMLRMLADLGKRENYNFKLIGIDANRFTASYAEKLSTEYDNISYLCMNIFSEEFKNIQYDIVLCTLTLHHFTDKEITDVVSVFNEKAAIGIVINDLHRSSTAYVLFNAICHVFGLNRMSREDGLTSIMRGFKKEELQQFAKKTRVTKSSIKWKWAFRYQWIIEKI